MEVKWNVQTKTPKLPNKVVFRFNRMFWSGHLVTCSSEPINKVAIREISEQVTIRLVERPARTQTLWLWRDKLSCQTLHCIWRVYKAIIWLIRCRAALKRVDRFIGECVNTVKSHQLYNYLDKHWWNQFDLQARCAGCACHPPKLNCCFATSCLLQHPTELLY